MSRGRRRNRGRGGLMPGLIMIAVGTMFLLGRFGYASTGQVLRFWPLLVVCVGLAYLIRPANGRPSIFLLLLGIWLQVSMLELFGLGFGDSWPLLIIFVGASLVFDAAIAGRFDERAARDVVIEVEAVSGDDDER